VGRPPTRSGVPGGWAAVAVLRSIRERARRRPVGRHQVDPESLDEAAAPTVVGQREGHGFGLLGQVQEQAVEMGGLLRVEAVLGRMPESADGLLGVNLAGVDHRLEPIVVALPLGGDHSRRVAPADRGTGPRTRRR